MYKRQMWDYVKNESNKAKSKKVGIKKVEFTKVKLKMARITNVDLKIDEGNQVQEDKHNALLKST